MPRRVSYAQNGEDVRVWHAFRHLTQPLTYVDVGANEPRNLSITASLYDEGWRGLLVEADPELARELAIQRPRDSIVAAAAGDSEHPLTFYRVPGTGLGTLDAREAEQARARGYTIVETQVPCIPLDEMVARYQETHPEAQDIHFLSIDVEGAESAVLSGMTFTHFRPWVMCIEAVEPGTQTPSHSDWEPRVLGAHYEFVAFDGINRWYVGAEHRDLAADIATPFNALDSGEHGWVSSVDAELWKRDDQAYQRRAWQQLLLDHELNSAVPVEQYAQRIGELEAALAQVSASKAWLIGRAAVKPFKLARHYAHRVTARFPRGIRNAIIRERHLRHVNANMGHLTDSAYLGAAQPLEVEWLSTHPLIPVPVTGLDLTQLGEIDIRKVEEWLNLGPWDSDAELNARMDNHNDEIGRTQAALRNRIRIARMSQSSKTAVGERILIDVRALQSPAFGHRGIGRFAAAALRGVREVVSDQRISLLIDPGLELLPAELVGDCALVSRVDAAEFALFIEPSPMTHSPAPYLSVLHSGARTVAVVFDFIPMHYPSIYLRDPATRAEYAANLDALRHFQTFVCISQLVERELQEFLGAQRSHEITTCVAWPRDIDAAMRRESTISQKPSADAPIVLMTGDEPRKNTFGGLAGIAAATVDTDQRGVSVVGMAGQGVRVHHWSIAAAMRPGEAQTLERISDEELQEELSRAACVVVPSFDEGLSLPVIEALAAGCPVVASDIPAHRELIGSGTFLADPARPRSVARAIKSTRGRRGIARKQLRRLARHSHHILEDVIAAEVAAVSASDTIAPVPATSTVTHMDRPSPTRQGVPGGETLRIALATPWSPQKTGVADFSTAIGKELAHMCTLTVFTTADAEVEPGINHRSIGEFLADPEHVAAEFDAVITVVGNSHFHVPFVELTQYVDCFVIAHDTRMVEYYLSLRDRGGLSQVMRRTAIPEVNSSSVDLDEQIADMRLLRNAGMWEVARRAKCLIIHAPTAAPRIAQQTGIDPVVLPFANQRAPKFAHLTPEVQIRARERLGLTTGTEVIHLATFGFADDRTKQTDLVLEAAGWLQSWGHSIALHIVGSAPETQREALQERARDWNLTEFDITGFVSEEDFCAWLEAIDLGIQLRISPFLGVSGPLSDLGAFGTPAVASAGLCADVDAPAYIDRLSDEVSALTLAEAIEHRINIPMSVETREHLRTEYLATKTPHRYAEQLLGVVAAAVEAD